MHDLRSDAWGEQGQLQHLVQGKPTGPNMSYVDDVALVNIGTSDTAEAGPKRRRARAELLGNAVDLCWPSFPDARLLGIIVTLSDGDMVDEAFQAEELRGLNMS